MDLRGDIVSIGEKIKEIRKSLNINQNELAIKSGLSKNAIWNYENGKRIPTLDTLKKIAVALDVSMFALIDDYTVDRDMNIGERIRELRKSKKITQKEMSNILNINIRTYQKYESDEIALNLDTLSKIAIALGVTVSDILGESLPSKNLTLENFTTEELLEEIKRRAIKYGL